MFEKLARLYASAIAFLMVLIAALCAIAALAQYATALVVLTVAVALLRIVWARTRW